MLIEFYFGELQSSFPALQSESSLPQHFDRYYDQCLKQVKDVLAQIKDVSADESAKA